MQGQAADPAQVLGRLVDGPPLDADGMEAAVGSILAGEWGDAEIAAFLTAARGDRAAELLGGARALRQRMVPFGPPIPGTMDTCGTGGDRQGTFNVSTATAVVVAACGVPVAKHGNRGVSSLSGSADVLAELGVRPAADPDSARRRLERDGLVFLFAPDWHPAVRRVQPVRQRLRFRTLFNFLGPLCNPAGAEFLLIGVSRALRGADDPMGVALAALGVRAATVVNGGPLDEVRLDGPTDALVVTARGVVAETWTPADFGLPERPTDALRVTSAAESAAALRAIFAGKAGTPRDVVLANAAVALRTAGRAATLRDGAAMAAAAIDDGAADAKLAAAIQAAP